MALQKNTKALPFVEGPDKKTDPKLSAKPARLENAVIVGGTVAKCPGRDTLSSSIAGGGTQSSGEALFVYDNELTRINGGTTYGLAEGNDTWVSKAGGNDYSVIDKIQLVSGSSQVDAYDHVIVNGIGVIAWVGMFSSASPGLHVSVYDVESGTFYQTGQAALSSGGVAPRCVVLGNRVVILDKDGGTSLGSTVVNTAAPSTAVASLTTIRNDFLATGTSFDAFTYTAAMGVCVYPSTGGASLTFIAFDNTGAVLVSPAPTAVAALTGANGFIAAGIHANRDTAGNVYAVFGDTNALRTRFIVRDSSFGAVVAVTDIVTTGNWDGNAVANMLNAASLELTANDLTVYMTNGSSIGSGVVPCWLGVVTLDAAGIVTAFADVPNTQGLVITSDWATFDGSPALGVVLSDAFDGVTGSSLTGLQATGFVIRDDATVVARALSTQIGPLAINGARRVCRSSVVNDQATAFCFGEQGRFGVSGSGGGLFVNTTPRGVTRIDVSSTNAGRLPIHRIGETVYIGGALPRSYDGVQVAEAGIDLYPTCTAISAAGAGGSLSTGTYQYKAIWSWTNSQGELVRGPASPPADVAASASNTVSISFETMPLSMRDVLPLGVQVTLELYRTIANGSVFYKVSTFSTITTNQINFSAVSAQRDIDLSDGLSDANLIVGELLYEQGGVLPWEAPPPYKAACSHMGRLVICGLEDPFSWQPSSKWAQGEQLRFSSVNTYSVPNGTGPLVGCASMDGKLILFTTDTAYFVIGDGPDNLGGNAYGPPQPISGVDSGPISQAGIVETPLGVMYQAKGGWALLDRGLNASLIGADMEPYFLGPYLVRSALVDSKNEAVRILSDPGNDIVGQQTAQLVPSNGGVELVYNYLYNQWSSQMGRGGQACCLYGGQFTTVRSDGVVRRDNLTGFLDAGSTVSTLVETAWIPFASIEGFQRIWYAILLGTYWSDCTVTMRVAYNYEGTSPTVPTWHEAPSLDGTGIYTVDGGPLQLRHHLGRKCTAVKFQIYDSELQGTGRGMALTDLSLEFGVKKGVFKLPARQTA